MSLKIFRKPRLTSNKGPISNNCAVIEGNSQHPNPVNNLCNRGNPLALAVFYFLAVRPIPRHRRRQFHIPLAQFCVYSGLEETPKQM